MPATREAVTEAEQALGHPLPPLLRRIYLEVANGGIGPDQGILDLGVLLEQNSISWPDDPVAEGAPPPLPQGMLFLVDRGCANWTAELRRR